MTASKKQIIFVICVASLGMSALKLHKSVELFKSSNKDKDNSLQYWNIPTSSRARRQLPHTGSSILYADWIYDSPNGSFWLPQPPSKPISGYERKETGNKFQTQYYKGRSGFISPDYINIMMSSDFNADNFMAYFIAPMIAGRRAEIDQDATTNRCSLSVVGSILHWGIRYTWGPGMIQATNKVHALTQIVFALRGPISHQQAVKSTRTNQTKIHPVYGDSGLLMSWYYQPNNTTKAHELCLIPHHVDRRHELVKASLNHETKIHVLNIRDPFFQIMDTIVQCDFVLSSSLHGLILSDSYGIPNAHVVFSDLVQGGHHKFDDYFGSVQRAPQPHLNAVGLTSSDMNVVKEFVQSETNRYRNTLSAPQINTLPFWQACPMHAEAYDRTREQHLEFARSYAQTFETLLPNRVEHLNFFIDQVKDANTNSKNNNTNTNNDDDYHASFSDKQQGTPKDESQKDKSQKQKDNKTNGSVILPSSNLLLPPTCQRLLDWRTTYKPDACDLYKGQLIQGILFYESLREAGVSRSKVISDRNNFLYSIHHEGAQESLHDIIFPILFPRRLVEFSCQHWNSPRPWHFFFRGIPNGDRKKWLEKVPQTKNESRIEFSSTGRSVKKETCDYDFDYYQELASAEFGLAPRGDFTWTYRFWESALMGAIPIVQKAHYHEASMGGYKVRLVDNWDDKTAAFSYKLEDAQHNFELLVKQHTTLSDVNMDLVEQLKRSL